MCAALVCGPRPRLDCLLRSKLPCSLTHCFCGLDLTVQRPATLSMIRTICGCCRSKPVLPAEADEVAEPPLLPTESYYFSTGAVAPSRSSTIKRVRCGDLVVATARDGNLPYLRMLLLQSNDALVSVRQSYRSQAPNAYSALHAAVSEWGVTPLRIKPSISCWCDPPTPVRYITHPYSQAANGHTIGQSEGA